MPIWLEVVLGLLGLWIFGSIGIAVWHLIPGLGMKIDKNTLYFENFSVEGRSIEEITIQEAAGFLRDPKVGQKLIYTYPFSLDGKRHCTELSTLSQLIDSLESNILIADPRSYRYYLLHEIIVVDAE